MGTMVGKKIIFYILAASIVGTFVLLYVQYNSSKNITLLIDGNQKYLDEYHINSELKELEKDVVGIESNISDVISTNNPEDLKGMDVKIAKVDTDLDHLQQISDDSVTVKKIDELDSVVQKKILFSKALLTSFYTEGKGPAEKLIATQRGKRLMDSIYHVARNIEASRLAVIARLTASNINSGKKAQRFNTILLVLVLVFGAALFWYIINIIQKLILSEMRVKESAQVKENFMANMSHEIRTPMNAILGFTNLLQRKTLDKESKEYVQTIQKSGENLLTIINDILDLSKIEAGMMRIETAPFNMRGLIHSIETMFRGKATEKGIGIISVIDESLPETLEGDATRLTQIMVNLVGNAIKFTQKGSVTIAITNEGEKDNVINTGIIITDTGIGISKENLDKIFDRFKQAEDSITRKYGGTGLGLAIAKELIVIQKGRVVVESEPGKGTNFHITIPYKIASTAVAATFRNQDNTIKQADVAGVYVLVAEDNEINQSLIMHLFKSWNLLFDLVNNGKEAIEKLAAYPDKYNLVLMDIQMPEMDGYTASQLIRHQLKNDIPVIAMTAHALAGEREKCLTYGMSEYISKPIREQELHDLITRLAQTKPLSVLPPSTAKKEDICSYTFINLSYMKEISGGNKEYEKTVTEQFIEAIPEELAAMEKAWKSSDIIQLQQLSHNLKTTVSVMGLNEKLQTFLDALEYQNLKEATFQQNFQSVTAACDGALTEAKQLYACF